MTIIGVSGLVRSGKDTLAELLIQRGFYGFSLGDYVRTKALQRHKGKTDPISVENMTETANWLRDTYGADVVLSEAIKSFELANKDNHYKGLVLYSVRVPVEVDFILKKGGVIVWVEANTETRYKRSLQALREGETEQTIEEFERQEALQWKPQPGNPANAQMNVSYVKDNATIIIENNNSSLEEFRAKIYKELKDYLS